MDYPATGNYNAKTLENLRFLRDLPMMGVFARLVPALVFKTSGGFEQSSLWVRFPYTPVHMASVEPLGFAPK
jgi:hypothetical protein